MTAVHVERSPRILVTGATGFVGSRLIRTLIDRGYETYAVARRAEKLIEIVGRASRDRFTILAGDLLKDDFSSLAAMGMPTSKEHIVRYSEATVCNPL